MAEIFDTSTNGVVSQTLIKSIVAELNRMNRFLIDMGYEVTSNGMLYTADYNQNGTLRSSKDWGADEVKIVGFKKTVTVTKDAKAHGQHTINLPRRADVGSFNTFTVGVQAVNSDASKNGIATDLPYVSIVSNNGDTVVFNVRTMNKATSTYLIRVNIIGLASETGSTF